MAGFGAQFLQDVEAALPAAGGTPRSVHARVGYASRQSVRHALRELVRRGRAVAIGPDGARRYGRATTNTNESGETATHEGASGAGIAASFLGSTSC